MKLINDNSVKCDNECVFTFEVVDRTLCCTERAALPSITTYSSIYYWLPKIVRNRDFGDWAEGND